MESAVLYAGLSVLLWSESRPRCGRICEKRFDEGSLFNCFLLLLLLLLLFFVLSEKVSQMFFFWMYRLASAKVVDLFTITINILKIKASFWLIFLYPPDIYLIEVNNGNTRTVCKICSKLTIKTPEWSQWRRVGVFVVNFQQILHIVLVFALLILNK